MELHKLQFFLLDRIVVLVATVRWNGSRIFRKREGRDFNALVSSFANRPAGRSERPLLEGFVADRVPEPVITHLVGKWKMWRMASMASSRVQGVFGSRPIAAKYCCMNRCLCDGSIRWLAGALNVSFRSPKIP